MRKCIRYVCLDRVRQLSGAWAARYTSLLGMVRKGALPTIGDSRLIIWDGAHALRPWLDRS